MVAMPSLPTARQAVTALALGATVAVAFASRSAIGGALSGIGKMSSTGGSAIFSAAQFAFEKTTLSGAVTSLGVLGALAAGTKIIYTNSQKKQVEAAFTQIDNLNNQSTTALQGAREADASTTTLKAALNNTITNDGITTTSLKDEYALTGAGRMPGVGGELSKVKAAFTPILQQTDALDTALKRVETREKDVFTALATTIFNGLHDEWTSITTLRQTALQPPTDSPSGIPISQTSATAISQAIGTAMDAFGTGRNIDSFKPFAYMSEAAAPTATAATAGTMGVPTEPKTTATPQEKKAALTTLHGTLAALARETETENDAPGRALAPLLARLVGVGGTTDAPTPGTTDTPTPESFLGQVDAHIANMDELARNGTKLLLEPQAGTPGAAAAPAVPLSQDPLINGARTALKAAVVKFENVRNAALASITISRDTLVGTGSAPVSPQKRNLIALGMAVATFAVGMILGHRAAAAAAMSVMASAASEAAEVAAPVVAKVETAVENGVNKAAEALTTVVTDIKVEV